MWVLRVHVGIARLGIGSNACLQMYKHGLNSQITTNSSPKPNKNPLFKHGFGVDS